MTERNKALSVLTLNTLAFTVCFACWMMNGVLVTFLVENGVFHWDKAQIGWLIGIPVLTGAVMRLPVGILTDKYGGKVVYVALMLVSAVTMYLTSYADSFVGFALGSLGFGLAGASFAVGVAYTSIWFPSEKQGTVLGIFGMGNMGAALTSMGGPLVLKCLTDNGTHLEGWRNLPKLYAMSLVVTTVLFLLFTHSRKVAHGMEKTLPQRLSPLKRVRVWRFGLYYFLTFGGFVALSQWLIPYYVNVYTMTIAMAGMMAAVFSLPGGVIRAFGGWLSDKFGARRVMYWVLISCVAGFVLLLVPRMDIYSPGGGIMAMAAGTVTEITGGEIVVSGMSPKHYPVKSKDTVGVAANSAEGQQDGLVLPKAQFWQEPVVKVGDAVKKRQLLARGITHIYFQANVWIFTFLALVVGLMMGIGNAAIYKHIPTYFPQEVGVVGGIVGVIGGLGGFFGPIIFGYLLKMTGIWTTCWFFLLGLAVVCLVWMHAVIQRMMAEGSPKLAREMEFPEIVQIEGLAKKIEGLAEKLRHRERPGES